MINNIVKIVDKWAADEPSGLDIPIHSIGCKFQRNRLKEVCELALQNYEGDILEIGCHIGLTTVIFAELAEQYGRRVITVDPWNGMQEGNQQIYECFMENTIKHQHVIDVNRCESQSGQGKKVIQEGKFAFCWIDGLHTPWACRQDIESCSTQTGILAVDDLRWLPALEELFYHCAKKYDFKHHYDDRCREGYYVSEK